jgi:hypothetical protein
MKFYVIDKSNRIVVRESSADNAPQANFLQFSTEAELMKLAVELPTSKLISIWNNLPGVALVARFTSRKVAISRIWQALRTLPQETSGQSSGRGDSRLRSGRTKIAVNNSVPDSKKSANSPDGTRTGVILTLLNRTGGATIDDLRQATGWKSHSVRGFISGTIRKKMNLQIASDRNESGVRVYRVQP